MPKPNQGIVLTGFLLAVVAVILLAVDLPMPITALLLAGLAMVCSVGLGFFLGRRKSPAPDEKEQAAPGQRVRTTLSERVVFERITAAILEDFVHCTTEEFEVNMNRVLSRLGSYTGASRCYLYRLDESQQAANLTLSWTRPGETDLLLPPSSLNPGKTNIHDWLRKGNLTLLGDLEQDDPASTDRCPGLVGTDVRAIGIAPIQQHGKLLGFLGFDSQDTHQWGSQESNLLLLVADLFVAIWSKMDAERVMHEAMENLKASDLAKTDFLANMSHEIRTPMNCILGISDLLIEMEPTDRQLSYLNMIHDSGYSLLTLINEILDLSKIEAGQLELDPVETDLRQLIEETISLVAFQAQGKGLEVVCRIDHDLPQMVHLDPGRLRQILTNLLNNATKFTEFGHILLEVETISQGSDSVDIRFTVHDTGVGIASDKLEIIFDKFSQAELSTTREFGGTGLGLTISQNLVMLMGGEITATSRVGKGSAFSFTIPVKPLGSAPAYAPVEETQGVLVVTDFEPCSKTMAEMLQSLKLTSCVVATWDLALELLTNQPMDEVRQWSHVLLDSKSCPASSLDIGKALEKIAEPMRPQVLLLTSLTDLHLDSDLKSWGFSGSLTKPIFIPRLVDAMAGRIEQRQEIPQPSPALACPLSDEEPMDSTEPRPRILLVEDNIFNQKVASGMLKMLNCEVEIANNGQIALKYAEENDFDLIFMDCQMPIMDGFETTRLIRQLSGPRGEVPIVAMTANVLPRDLEACIVAGMNDTTTKPITRDILKSVLEKWIPVNSPS